MVSRKRIIIIGVVFLLIVGGAALIIYKLKKAPKAKYSGYPDASQVIKPNSAPPLTKEFSAIQSDFLAKKWVDVAPAASLYGNNTANSINLRISTYAFCVYAATTISNTSLAADCRQKGTELIAQLKTEEDRAATTKIFDAIAKDGDYKEENSAQSDSTHE